MTYHIGRRRLLAALLALAVTTAPLVACGQDDDHCSTEDLASQEDECGYWTDHPDSGQPVFILYPWIVPGVGGKPPAGHRPVPPAGAHRARPHNAPAPPHRPAPVRVNPPPAFRGR